jgi:hypothetical protein
MDKEKVVDVLKKEYYSATKKNEIRSFSGKWRSSC